MEEHTRFDYKFELSNGENIHLELDLDGDLALVNFPSEDLPRWVKLEYHQCPNCPLNPDEHPNCPVAVNLVPVLDKFRNIVSHQQATVTIETDDRTYMRTDDVQRGLSSLMGVLMASSGCPILDKLRPMVRTHLPFSSLRETVYRAVSMYILAQHFRDRKNLKTEYSLDGLKKIYNEITQVNYALSSRVRSYFSFDANINALIILNCMAEYTAVTLEDDLLDEIERLFSAYYK
jgi:hypothetical protein